MRADPAELCCHVYTKNLEVLVMHHCVSHLALLCLNYPQFNYYFVLVLYCF